MKKQLEDLSGYKLVSVVDLGEMTGTCQREGCNHSIRYQFHIKHETKNPKVVGSTCIDNLTQADQTKGLNDLSTLKKIAKIVSYTWNVGKTKKGFNYSYYKYNDVTMKIYMARAGSCGIQLSYKNGDVTVYTEIENYKVNTLNEAKLKACEKVNEYLKSIRVNQNYSPFTINFN